MPGCSFLVAVSPIRTFSLAAALALFAASGLAKPAALNGPQFVIGAVLRQPLSIQGDQATPNTGPGLGIEVDEKKVQALMFGSSGI